MVKKNYAPRYVKRINRFVGRMFNQKPPTLGELASGVGKAISIATKLATAINSEKKYFDDSYVMTTVPMATPVIRLVTHIAGGTGVSDRIGNSVSLNKMYSRHLISWNNPGNTTGAVILRHMLIVDNNDNAGTAPVLAQVLQSTSTPLDRISSPLNLTNKTRFRVLKDSMYFFDNSKPMFETSMIHKFKLMKDSNGNRTNAHHCTWYDGTATNTQKGNIYEILISYQNGTGINDPSVGGTNRIRYFDN